MQRLLAQDTPRLVLWTIGSLALLCIGCIGGLLLTVPFAPHHDALVVFSIVGAIFGGIVGAGQIWMLSLENKHINTVRDQWIPTHIVIGAMCSAIFVTQVVPFSSAVGSGAASAALIGYLYGVICGIAIGGAEWYVIKSHLRRSGQWALATVVAWGAWWALMGYIARNVQTIG